MLFWPHNCTFTYKLTNYADVVLPLICWHIEELTSQTLSSVYTTEANDMTAEGVCWSGPPTTLRRHGLIG